MSNNTFIRTERLLGKENIERLKNATVTVCGLGAVGGFTLEMLARSGIGHLRLFDFDRVSASNINRQILALHSTLGEEKTAIAEKRVKDINPDCIVEKYNLFINGDNLDLVISGSDVICDCIDSVREKTDLIEKAYKAGIPIVTSTGAALKKDTSFIKSGDLMETKGDALAKKLRSELKKRNVRKGIRAIYSTERVSFEYIDAKCDAEAETVEATGKKRMVLGSMPTVTSVFGIMVACEAINILLDGVLNSYEV